MAITIRIDEIGPNALRQAARAVILRALREHGGNAEEAAAALGMGNSTMYRKIREHNITDEERTR